MLRHQRPSCTRHQLVLSYIWATSSRIPENFLLQAQIVLLPNDGVLPTASIFTESSKEIFFLPNGISLPNSAHKSVPFLYQFLVLTQVDVHEGTWKVFGV
jgi:hypothetical protein